MIAFVGPGVGHLNDPDLPGEGIFTLFYFYLAHNNYTKYRTRRNKEVARRPNRNYRSLWDQLNLLRFYSSKVNGSSIFKAENSYQAENQGFCYKLILIVSPGTYLVKNQESQFRTNESKLKKKSPKLKMFGLLCNQTVNLKTDSKTR